MRIYGQDLVQRLARPGLQVEVFRIVEHVTTDEATRLGVWDDRLFVCRRPAAAG